MTLRAEPVDREAWLAVASSDPRCTFFHTPWWSDVAEATRTWVDDSIMGTFDGGKTVVLPRVRAGRRVVSGWAGCYGGPVSAGELRAEEHAEALRATSAGAARTSVVGNPFRAPGNAPRWQVRTDRTLAIEINGMADYPSLRRAFSRGHKANINSALRAGFSIGIADAEARVGEYIALSAVQTRERGAATTSSYPPQVFRRLAALAASEPDAVRLWVADFDGIMAAGLWALTFNGHTALWHTASVPRGQLKRSPNLALYEASLRDAHERGQRWLDFNPSGGHAGVVAMKRGFGAQELPFDRLTRFGFGARARGALRRVGRAA